MYGLLYICTTSCEALEVNCAELSNLNVTPGETGLMQPHVDALIHQCVYTKLLVVP